MKPDEPGAFELAAFEQAAKALGEHLHQVAEQALQLSESGFEVNWHTLRHYALLLMAGTTREPATRLTIAYVSTCTSGLPSEYVIGPTR